ncbi:hypothetical protein [Agreia pratensis]|uniref:Uncharacterized protein n=1 Tax=Agreia pratensis TaxID=150121 RepID=A0A1X7JBS6_9MICO|nr:hypothetical protein [Agreia pratensis]SMG25020.1 hypothetical protein SAMN06296010_1218 [Agreia pratensis]
MTRPLWLTTVLVLALATLTGCSAGVGNAPSATGEPSKTPAASASPSATDDPEASGAQTGGRAAALPRNCESIYSPAYLDKLGSTPGIALNPEWTATPGQATLGSTEPALIDLLKTKERLDCFWVSPGGGSGSGLATSISLTDGDEESVLLSDMTAAGFTCSPQRAGIRCEIDRTDDYASWGETHFIGGGLWIATSYVEFAPVGYTDDIVATLFPS